jgi:hypothetical protein
LNDLLPAPLRSGIEHQTLIEGEKLMMNKIAAIFGLACGTSLLLYWGGEAPRWLLMVECAAVMVGALLFGFTSYSPSAPDWLRHEAVRGVALVYLGVGAVFMPTNLLMSAFLIGCGCRLVMKSAVQVSARVMNVSIDHSRGDIVLRETGNVATREAR